MTISWGYAFGHKPRSHFIKWLLIPTVVGTFLCVRNPAEIEKMRAYEGIPAFYGQ